MPQATEIQRPTARDIAKRIFRHENAVLASVLAVLIVGLAVITGGKSISPVNVRNVILQSSMRGIAAIGELFVILTANIDLAVGGVGLMASILGSTLLTERLESNIIGFPVPLIVGVLIMLLVGMSIGAFNGFLVSRIHVPALIVTLSVWLMTTGGAYQICRGFTIMGLPRSASWLGQGVVAGVPVPIIVFVTVAAVAYFVLNYTTFGRSVYAVGGNPVSAYLSGIKVQNVQLSVYIISGFLAAFASFVTLSRIMSSSLKAVTGLEIDAIAAVAIGGISLAGGRGNILGVVVGTIIMGVINNFMNVMEVAPALYDMIKGGVIFAAVAVDSQRRKT